MTTKFYLRISIILLLVSFISSAFAQPSDFKNLQPALLTNTPVKVYDNILTEFQKKYKGAENVKWHILNKDFLAKFSMEDCKKNVLLNRRGRVLYSISYGTEKQLPVNMRKMIKGMYVEHLITSATLVEEANRKIWVIALETDSHHKTVRVENDELEETENFQKSTTRKISN